MELPIRNCILYKLRTLEKRKKQLEELKKCLNERKRDVIDETNSQIDGLPHGKGKVSNPVESKVIRFEQLDKRIKTLEGELDTIASFEKKIQTMDSLTVRIYNETIKKQSNLEYKAMEYGMATKTLYNYRSALLKMIATDLGEYLDLDKII